MLIFLFRCIWESVMQKHQPKVRFIIIFKLIKYYEIEDVYVSRTKKYPTEAHDYIENSGIKEHNSLYKQFKKQQQ